MNVLSSSNDRYSLVAEQQNEEPFLLDKTSGMLDINDPACLLNTHDAACQEKPPHGHLVVSTSGYDKLPSPKNMPSCPKPTNILPSSVFLDAVGETDSVKENVDLLQVALQWSNIVNHNRDAQLESDEFYHLSDDYDILDAALDVGCAVLEVEAIAIAGSIPTVPPDITLEGDDDMSVELEKLESCTKTLADELKVIDCLFGKSETGKSRSEAGKQREALSQKPKRSSKTDGPTSLSKAGERTGNTNRYGWTTASTKSRSGSVTKNREETLRSSGKSPSATNKASSTVSLGQKSQNNIRSSTAGEVVSASDKSTTAKRNRDDKLSSSLSSQNGTSSSIRRETLSSSQNGARSGQSSKSKRGPVSRVERPTFSSSQRSNGSAASSEGSGRLSWSQTSRNGSVSSLTRDSSEKSSSGSLSSRASRRTSPRESRSGSAFIKKSRGSGANNRFGYVSSSSSQASAQSRPGENSTTPRGGGFFSNPQSHKVPNQRVGVFLGTRRRQTRIVKPRARIGGLFSKTPTRTNNKALALVSENRKVTDMVTMLSVMSRVVGRLKTKARQHADSGKFEPRGPPPKQTTACVWDYQRNANENEKNECDVSDTSSNKQ